MNLISLISKHKNKLPGIIIIILSLIIASNIYKSQLKTVESLKEKKDLEIRKNEILNQISQNIEKTLNPYKQLLNTKDTSLLIDTISNIAKESGIKINSLKPQTEEQKTDYIKYSFDLEIAASDYHNLGKFINKIENSSDVYLVEALNIKAIPGQSGEGPADRLSAELRLSTILMRD
jgi:Tfp pilus assembly protein PilO